MKILYIGEANTYSLYKAGIVPSHWLYGACEMQQAGHDVVWQNESTSLTHDLSLIRKHKPDIIFIPNLNLRNHLLLLVLSSLMLLRVPIYAYLHHTPRLNTSLSRFLLSGVKHLFFLSSKTREDIINSKLKKPEKCIVLPWGADTDFYDAAEKSDEGYFISTGKENRDFDTLIEAFRLTGKPLLIMTAKSHNNADYSDLQAKCKDIPNIQVKLLDNSPSNFPLMLKAMAGAKALVCCLNQDKLNYCVGLSTIADAEGLGKPLIITDNPYHDHDRTADFLKVRSVSDWIDAINILCDDEDNRFPIPSASTYSIKNTYKQLRRFMNLK